MDREVADVGEAVPNRTDAGGGTKSELITPSPDGLEGGLLYKSRWELNFYNKKTHSISML